MPVEPDPGAFQFPASEPVVSTPVTPPKTEPLPFAPEPTEPSTFVPQPTEPSRFAANKAESSHFAAKQAEPSPFPTEPSEPSAFTPEKIEPPVPSTFAPPKSDFVATPPASNQFKVNLDVQENPVPTFAPPKLFGQPKLNNHFSQSNKLAEHQFVPSTLKPRFENVPKTPKSEKIRFESLDRKTAARKTDLILELSLIHISEPTRPY